MFQAVNCAAINENLLESELFGHEKGSFTGAHAEKKGLFEIADRGTLFLDEIAELDVGIQAKLLRALQERKIRRVGGTHEINVDVRVIAATNRDLRAMVADGRFRDDLYYRINVLSIDVPPLRERREDIPVLIDYFLKKHTKNTSRLVTGLTPETKKLMNEYSWPGNVRQLESAIERAILLSEGDLITPGRLADRSASGCWTSIGRRVQATGRRNQLRRRRAQSDHAGDGADGLQHHQGRQTPRPHLPHAPISAGEVRHQKTRRQDGDEEE